MMSLPNILTFLRILLTPIFIICLFGEFEQAKMWALLIFVFASITDAYDGYYARKNNMVTDTGRFLAPLADKILVSSAFISFSIMGLIDFWMVGLIIFRDLFVTSLRIIMTSNGFTMMTSTIAKSKTTLQIIMIIFTLIFLSISGYDFPLFHSIIKYIVEFELIYYLTMLVSIFTIYTGLAYVIDNRKAIKEIMN